MKNEYLKQLEAEEQQLLKRLSAIRREKLKLKQPKEPQRKAISNNSTNYTLDTLEALSKPQIINILINELSANLTDVQKRKTKKYLVGFIITLQKAYARGEAFRKMTN